jgi:hypothetical protein
MYIGIMYVWTYFFVVLFVLTLLARSCLSSSSDFHFRRRVTRLGDCFLWVDLKNGEAAQIRGLLFSTRQVLY